MKHFCCILFFFLIANLTLEAGVRTWDSRYDISKIEVAVVYFVPSDRPPLVDWRDRVDYFCKRIELFHAREFQGQSEMKTLVHAEPLISESTTAQLRVGDANAIYSRTVEESHRRLKFAEGPSAAFRILLVLSDINWKPLDDFYRLHPEDGDLIFEGHYRDQQHFPGAESGGSRAAYFPNVGIGKGLVSADGWRVPYRGSDNVIYHEGCGHTVGLPHPDPVNDSVMGLAQYRGWLSESWLDKEQKLRLGWEPGEISEDLQTRLFTEFKVIPEPKVPKPGEQVRLKLDWPHDADVQSLQVRYQTSIHGPWIDVPQPGWNGDTPETALLGPFERETPVSFRVDATLKGGQAIELWSYLQVRTNPEQILYPTIASPDLAAANAPQTISVIEPWPAESVDLLALADPKTCWTSGQWTKDAEKLLSPKQYGARLELPYSPPEEYRMTVIVEPLEEPNGLLLGLRSGKNRFAALFNYGHDDQRRSAIENVDGRNVGNETTFEGTIFRKNQMSQIIVTVRTNRVTMMVDGHVISDLVSKPDRLSLSDYWKTPNDKNLFLGAYDCRYRFHRVTLEPLKTRKR